MKRVLLKQWIHTSAYNPVIGMINIINPNRRPISELKNTKTENLSSLRSSGRSSARNILLILTQLVLYSVLFCFLDTFLTLHKNTTV